MEFYSDLHIHSRFSRACSKRLTIPEIYRWSLLKGIELIGTSDFTHPKWFEEIKEHLVEDDTGLLKLKKSFKLN
jgi:PHP family Zn ribbon phosphoesterase